MTRRGTYRGVFSSLIADPDYQQLSPSARLVLLTLRLCPEAGAAAIFRVYLGTVVEQTGLDAGEVEMALVELARSPAPESPWIYREGPIVWVRNGLRYDPHLRLADKKHRMSVERAVSALPRLAIVASFCRYYQIASPFEAPPKTLRSPSEDPSLPSTETEVLPEVLPEAEGRDRDRVVRGSSETLYGQPSSPRLRRVKL